MGSQIHIAAWFGQVGAQRRFAAGAKRLLSVSMVAMAACAVLVSTTARADAVDDRPNIVLITTDDMSKSDLRWMPKTRKLLGSSGVQVGDFLSNHPLCCPARAQILTGQYAQNNGVTTNDGPYGGYEALADAGNHIGRWLKSAGYKTAFVGKHINHWPENGERQPGWTIFNPILEGVYAPFDFTMYNNGRPRAYSGTHTSDVMGGLTVRYVRRFSASGSPFFVWTSQVAPHNMSYRGEFGRPVPAARHRDLYPNALPPAFSDPAFNEDDVRDKPDYVRASRKVSRTEMIQLHRARIRSLRSVDDQVGATVAALRAAGELDDTYIFFTSDNGFLLGEHRQLTKNYPYEQALQIPLLVRGPSIPRGTVRPSTYGLVDLAATFVDIAQATPGRLLDGRSMLGTLHRGAPGYGQYLIQAGPPAVEEEQWWWRGVRSRRYVYVRYESGFEELYDMASDPAQLDNVASDPAFAAVREDYAARLTALETCAGAACWTGGDATVTFTDSARRLPENTGEVQLQVVRGGNTDLPASVEYAARAGSATGRDFALAPGTLRFSAGETTKRIALRVNNDARAEAAEALRISLRPADEQTVTQPGATLRVIIGASDQQPDVAVSARAGSSYVGDDIYNLTGARQTRVLSAQRRQTRTFRVRVENDGNARTVVSLKGSSPRSGARVRFYSAANDRTRLMLSPRGWRVSVPSKGHRTVKVQVTPLRAAAISSRKQAAIRAEWTGDGTQADVVRAVVRVAG